MASVIVPASWKYFAGVGQASSEGCACFESVSNIWCCFSHSQNSWVQESRGRNRCENTITFSDSLTTFLLSISVTLCPASLEVLVPKVRMLSLEDIMILLEWKGAAWPLWTLAF